MDRLTLVITLLSSAFLTAGLLVAGVSLGYDGWVTIVGSIIIALGVSLPAARVMSVRIKRLIAERKQPITRQETIVSRRDDPKH
ncbi:MAG: hypothetical protein AAFY35_13435 [Pseudomonadota bacterium]